MPSKNITTETGFPEIFIDAIYRYTENNPGYIMPMHDIYALYDIATHHFERNMEQMLDNIKQEKKSKKVKK